MTGCGATSLFLDDNKPTVLCVPRRELGFCKANSRQFAGKVHLFGSASYTSVKDTTTVVDKINDMKDYVQSHYPLEFNIAPKIIVTYDSSKHVIRGLRELGVLDRFRFVVDEFQTIFTDAAFRGDTEAEFMENLRQTSSVIFLSATPYLEDYLDELDEFKELPYIELKWPESSVHHTHIKSMKYTEGSPNKTIDGIIKKYQSQGFFEETMDQAGNRRRSNQAVFFVNHVKFIISAIKRNNLKPSDVNIICSTANDNEKKLRMSGLKIGHAPKEGEQHCPYTFVTKAAYEGVDFYSPCAFTYIFSDITLKSLAIDISLDIAQIMGRQRLSSNIFRYGAIFFYKTTLGYTEAEENAFMDVIKHKVEETEEAVNDFANCKDISKRNRDARKYKLSQQKEKYENDYITVIDDTATNSPKMVFNKYVMINEIRAWRVQQEQYLNGTMVMGNINNTSQSGSSDKVKLFRLLFRGCFEDKMRLYAEFMESNPECKQEVQGLTEVPFDIKEYYNILGIERLRALSWKESRIKLEISSSSKTLEDRIVIEFTEPWYSYSEIKGKLQQIYDDCCPGVRAKATDLKKYMDCVEKKKRTSSGVRENGYQIRQNN